jgi:hypothetical protein
MLAPYYAPMLISFSEVSQKESMKAPLLVVSLLGLALPVGLFAQWPDADPFKINYAANLNVGDSALNFTNSGASGGDICLNLYVFSPDQEEQACCNVTLSPNSLYSAALLTGLLSNPLIGGKGSYLSRWNSAVVKAIATAGVCSSSAGSVTSSALAPGLIAWGTHYHITANGAGAITEVPFEDATLSGTEFHNVVGFCGFLESGGVDSTGASGAGQCPPPTVGGLNQKASLTTKLGSTANGL